MRLIDADGVLYCLEKIKEEAVQGGESENVIAILDAMKKIIEHTPTAKI